jgi:hypothetical protein
MEEVRGARKEVDLRCHPEGSPPKLDFGQGWGKAEISSCHDDLYGRRVFFTRKRRLSRTKIEPGRKREKVVKSKRIWHEKEIRFR